MTPDGLMDLFIHLEIPIPTEPLVGASALTFARWLPIGDSQAINVERDGIALRLGSTSPRLGGRVIIRKKTFPAP